MKDNNTSQLCVTQIMYVTQFPNNQPLLWLHSDNCELIVKVNVSYFSEILCQ